MIFGYFFGLLNAALLGGIIFWLCGAAMQRYKPEWPNVFYGYRTPRSLQSKESFDAANEFSAHLMKKYGIVLAAFGLLCALFTTGSFFPYFTAASTTALLAAAFLLILKTESHLKEAGY